MRGDVVLDCFCGSGTTAAVAEKLNRRWIACDLGRFAIHTTRKRLLGIPGVKPFVVQNLGKYERQQWQVAEFAPASSTVILSGKVAKRTPWPSRWTRQRRGKEFSERTSKARRDASQASRSCWQTWGPSTPLLLRFANSHSAQDDKGEGGAQDAGGGGELWERRTD